MRAVAIWPDEGYKLQVLTEDNFPYTDSAGELSPAEAGEMLLQHDMLLEYEEDKKQYLVYDFHQDKMLSETEVQDFLSLWRQETVWGVCVKKITKEL